MKKIIVFVLFIILTPSICFAANLELSWSMSPTATGYRIYQSVDNGVTWDAGIDVLNVLTHVVPNVPDSGLVLFRVGAYNTNSATIRTWSGAWFNGDWQPPSDATTLGIK